MLTITLLPQEEYRWRGENPSPATFPSHEGKYPLYHQYRTYHAEAPIIINTSNTGTGKTKAALLRLLKRAQQRGFEQLSPQDNALLIAPTNALLKQHVADAREFCEQNHLPYHVLSLTREDIDGYQLHTEEHLRRSAQLDAILNDPSRIDKDLTKKATLVVVNPDIFYYALYFLYHYHDRSMLFYTFFNSFNYIVIDEFHYYDPKQLAAFLFFLKFSQEMGYIDNESKKRQFCILTATPRPQVARYLTNLGIEIAWIRPGEEHISPQDRPSCEPVQALAPIELSVYSTTELQKPGQPGDLSQLVMQKSQEVKNWLATEIQGHPLDGAIISDSLGAISRIRQVLLRAGIPDTAIGRITGPEKQAQREQAKEKPLILATPTVDIGYNFERSQAKSRQNIDFLLIEAHTGDALVQRLGRAGRVLAKKEKNHVSRVVALVDDESYRKLREYDQGTLDRATLAEIAASMPAKNDLYAYVRTGAILELSRPLAYLGREMPKTDRDTLVTFLRELQTCFSDGRLPGKPYDYTSINGMLRAYEDQHKHYQRLSAIPVQAFYTFSLLLERRLKTEEGLPSDQQKCVEAFRLRLKDVLDKGKGPDKNIEAIERWIRSDLCKYYKDRARFSFRDSFQPPLALVYDPDHMHSSDEVAVYDALHFLKYYHIQLYPTLAEWKKCTGQKISEETAEDVVLYGELKQLRDVPLQLGLQLDALQYKQDDWEALHAYQVTALHGLEIIVRNDDSGLKHEAKELLSQRFIPAFVARDDRGSHTFRALQQLCTQARFFSLPLEITFGNTGTVRYLAILGTMAFQVCAEIPFWALKKDLGKTQREDEEPIIC